LTPAFSQPSLTVPEGVFSAELGIVDDSFIGIEDHGVFSINLNFDFRSTGQGLGHRCIATSREQPDGTYKMIGTAVGCDYIIRLMEVLGVREWKEVVGQRVYCLRDGTSFGSILGLANVDDPAGSYIIFAPYFDSWKDQS
jgi:hypothetical protein